MQSTNVKYVMQADLPPEEAIKRDLDDLRAVIVERRKRSYDLWEKHGLSPLPPDVPKERRVIGRFTLIVSKDS
jgi:hypothetical protein